MSGSDNLPMMPGVLAGETAKLVIISLVKSMGVRKLRRAENILAMAEKIAAHLIAPETVPWPDQLIINPPNLRFSLQKIDDIWYLEASLLNGRLHIDAADLQQQVPGLSWNVMDEKTILFRLS